MLAYKVQILFSPAETLKFIRIYDFVLRVFSSLLLQHDCYFPSFLSSNSIPLPPLLPIRHPLLLLFYLELDRLLIDINQTWRIKLKAGQEYPAGG